jgi:fermentation-respiration switch protein FrsA (DUF1100 family)
MLLGLLQACSGLLFYPDHRMVRTPADLGLDYSDVTIRAADGTNLHGWWLPAQGAAKGTVFFLHGNAENISTHIGSVFWLPAVGYQVLLLDYRGFGRSEGRPALPAVFQDIEAGFAWLGEQPEVAGRPLFLLGQSLGAALGGYVAATEPRVRQYLAGVVLDAGIARYRWIAREAAARSWLTWPVQWPVGWSMPDDYDLLDVVDDLSPLPVMFIHGTHDEIVPFHHSQQLFAAAREPKSFLSYDGPHIGAFRDAENRRYLVQFFGKSAAGP